VILCNQKSHFFRASFSESPPPTFSPGQQNLAPLKCTCTKHFRELNNQKALERAKANVERYFPVVGILEELNVTLAVLENRLPYFFRGLQKIYFQDLMGKMLY
jgi:hypothetical protein